MANESKSTQATASTKKYRVIHGEVVLAHLKDEKSGEFAGTLKHGKGEIVDLSDADAKRMLPHGVIEAVA